MAKVFIGVGHGGKDPGAIGNGLRESDANLIMGCTLKSKLERHGAAVGISRTKDENDPLTEEIAEAIAYAPDIAVECHNNAGGGEGFEVYRQTGGFSANSIQLATFIEKQVERIDPNTNLFYLPNGFAVIVNLWHPLRRAGHIGIKQKCNNLGCI